jgi:hypothetical protein
LGTGGRHRVRRFVSRVARSLARSRAGLAVDLQTDPAVGIGAPRRGEVRCRARAIIYLRFMQSPNVAAHVASPLLALQTRRPREFAPVPVPVASSRAPNPEPFRSRHASWWQRPPQVCWEHWRRGPIPDVFRVGWSIEGRGNTASPQTDRWLGINVRARQLRRRFQGAMPTGRRLPRTVFPKCWNRDRRGADLASAPRVAHCESPFASSRMTWPCVVGRVEQRLVLDRWAGRHGQRVRTAWSKSPAPRRQDRVDLQARSQMLAADAGIGRWREPFRPDGDRRASRAAASETRRGEARLGGSSNGRVATSLCLRAGMARCGRPGPGVYRPLTSASLAPWTLRLPLP